MQRESRTIHIPKLVAYPIAAAMFLTGAALVSFAAFISFIALQNHKVGPEGAFTYAFGVSIGVIFLVLSTRFISAKANAEQELLSVAGWRRLALTLAILGGFGALLFGWVAVLPAAFFAGLCLLKDPRVAELLLWFP